MNLLLIFLGKFIIFVSRVLNLGHGSTWPGHIALMINPNFIKDILRKNYSSNEVRSSRFARTVKNLKIILIAGTNGKTTTGKLIQTILEKANYRVFQNESGANLLNGIASSMLLHSSILCKIKYDYAIFEVDENTLPLVLREIMPDYLILLNLFRDQLDRYGEVNIIASKWRDAIRHLLSKTTLILNADDPQIAYLGLSSNVIPAKAGIQKDDWMPDQVGHDKDSRTILYFGLNDKKLAVKNHQHAVDSTYCPNCSSKLTYRTIYYSHLGDWECKKCKLKRSNLDLSSIECYPVSGIYNRYNTLTAVLLAKQIDIQQKNINSALHEFTPAFGRQEILSVKGKKVQIFLSKNPTSFNESLRTIKSLGAKRVLFVLNDRIPDGRDVSWIWDVDFEDYVNDFENIIISGDRYYDMALRVKYATQNSNVKSQNQVRLGQNHNSKVKTYEELRKAVDEGLNSTKNNEILYILPTYSAMLEVRKILTGKKIL